MAAWTFLIGSALTVAVAASAAHPRLWFGAEDIAGLRSKVQHDPFTAMMQKLELDLWSNRWVNYAANQNDPSDMLHVARRHAFLYSLTGDVSLCNTAGEISAAVIAGPLGGNVWANASAFGLSMYDQVSKIALVYDFCYHAFNATFASYISNALVEGADVIVDSGGSQQNDDPASNWQGGRGSSAITAYLATDSPFNSSRLAWAINHTGVYLAQNYGQGQGWNIESLGYNLYPSPNFIVPAGLALLRNTSGAIDLRTVCHGAPYLALSPWVAGQNVLGSHLAHPDFSDDNANWAPEGLAGLSFAWAPEEYLPGVKWMYDRLVGPLNPYSNVTWDHQSSGTIWSVLYYRDDVTGQDPMDMDAWSGMFDDSQGNGKYAWRSGYSGNSSDIITMMYAKLRGARGHSAPDVLGLRLTGLNNSWIIGGGRYGSSACGAVDCYRRSQSTLYPLDPDAATGLSFNNYAGVLVGGQPLRKVDGSGHMTATVNVSNTGVTNHTRRLAVDYSGASGASATLVIVDTSLAGAVAQWMTLQGNGVAADAANGSWMVTGPDGATMQVTVLWPPAASLILSTGLRPRAQPYLVLDGLWANHTYLKAAYATQGEAGYSCGSNSSYVYCNFVVAMTLLPPGAGPHPVPSLCPAGRGAWDTPTPVGTVTAGQWTVQVDGDSIAS